MEGREAPVSVTTINTAPVTNSNLQPNTPTKVAQGLIPSDIRDQITADPAKFLTLLEGDATQCASSMVHLLGNLRSALHAITGISVQHMDVYKEAVDELTNTVNLSVMSTNVMITKAHELTQATSHVQQLAQQIKDIKKALDVFEVLANKMCYQPKSVQ